MGRVRGSPCPQEGSLGDVRSAGLDSWRLMKLLGLSVTLCTRVLSLGPGSHGVRSHCRYATGGHKSLGRDPRARVGGAAWLKSSPCGLAADYSPRWPDPTAAAMMPLLPGWALQAHGTAAPPSNSGTSGGLSTSSPPSLCPSAWLLGPTSALRQEPDIGVTVGKLGGDPAQVTAQQDPGGAEQWILWARRGGTSKAEA